jgi:hypothetical protein
MQLPGTSMLSQKKGLECWGSEMVFLLSKFFVGFYNSSGLPRLQLDAWQSFGQEIYV